MSIKNLIKKFEDKINSAHGVVHVIGHYDCDGICSSLIISKTIERMGKQTKITNIKSLEKSFLDLLSVENSDLLIFVDIGSGYKSELSVLNQEMIIIDHHIQNGPNSANILEINAIEQGYNGSVEICSSSLSFFISKILDSMNIDLEYLALMGIIGDRQHSSGLKGFNKKIIMSDETSQLSIKPLLNNQKSNFFSFIEDSFDPYLSHLFNQEVILNFPGNSSILKGKISNLSVDEILHLNSWIHDIILAKSSSVIPKSFTTRFFFNEIYDLNHISWIIDFAGRRGDFKTAFSCAMLDSQGLRKGQEHYIFFKNILVENLDKFSISENKLENIISFESNFPGVNGLLCGLIQDFWDEKNSTIAVYSQKDGISYISSRGTSSLISKGMNLSELFSKESSRLGGTGGGHAMAAGARFPLDDKSLKLFLTNLNKYVGKF